MPGTFAAWLALSACQFAGAQVTSRVSVDSTGAQGNGSSDYLWTALSGDGRFVAFASVASDLVSGDTNGRKDVFVHDRLTRVTERVSLSSGGTQGNQDSGSYGVAISADGRFVAFSSFASNLVPGDLGVEDIFVRDRQNGTTERVSVSTSGGQDDGRSLYPAISADGRFVSFMSHATDLVAGDTNGFADNFVRDRQSGTTERISVDSGGAQANADAWGNSTISADGNLVAFDSDATNLVAGDTNGKLDVFLRDRGTGTTSRVSLDSAGNQGDDWSQAPSISADGRFVEFTSQADNFAAGDSNNIGDVFVHDLANATTERVSVDSAGGQGDNYSFTGSISADGRFVAFESLADDLVAGDTNATWDVFLRDRQFGTTTRSSVSSTGTEGNDFSYSPVISADGRFVAFQSWATDLVAGDTNAACDTFVHGPWLTLEADPPQPAAGATLTFTTWTGAPSLSSLLVVIDVNGTPLFIPVSFGSFDAAGVFSIAATVPPGLSGNVVTLKTFGFVATGKVDVSNPEPVAFQ